MVLTGGHCNGFVNKQGKVVSYYYCVYEYYAFKLDSKKLEIYQPINTFKSFTLDFSPGRFKIVCPLEWTSSLEYFFRVKFKII